MCQLFLKQVKQLSLLTKSNYLILLGDIYSARLRAGRNVLSRIFFAACPQKRSGCTSVSQGPQH